MPLKERIASHRKIKQAYDPVQRRASCSGMDGGEEAWHLYPLTTKGRG